MVFPSPAMRNWSQEPAGGTAGQKGTGIQGSVCLNDRKRPWGEPGNSGLHHERATKSQRGKGGVVAFWGFPRRYKPEALGLRKLFLLICPSFKIGRFHIKNSRFSDFLGKSDDVCTLNLTPDGSHWLEPKSQPPWAQLPSLPQALFTLLSVRSLQALGLQPGLGQL